MTVAVNDRQYSAVGNGIIITFPFDFPVTAQGSVKVLLNGVEASTLTYTLNKVARTVTFLTAPAIGVEISILGNTPLSQLITSSRAGSTVNFSAVEEQLDNIVNAQQELQYNIATVIDAAADAVATASTAVTNLEVFNDLYLGEKTSLPTLDNDGDPLQNGALVSLVGQTPSSLNGMYVRQDGAWASAVGAAKGVFLGYRYVATAAQTTFSGADANGLTLSYTLGAIMVTVNGVTQTPNTYTASNGTSVVFGAGLSASDVVVIYSFGSFAVADTWTKIEADGRFATPASVTSAVATHSALGGTAHPAATTSVAGFMSAADKTKLDALPITKIYTSAQQTYTIGGSLTLAHGLGEVPKFAFVIMRCVTADHGYSIGDEFFWIGHTDGDGSSGRCNPPLIIRDGTNLNIRYAQTSFRLPLKSTNENTTGTPTAANWRAIFVAVA